MVRSFSLTFIQRGLFTPLKSVTRTKSRRQRSILASPTSWPPQASTALSENGTSKTCRWTPYTKIVTHTAETASFKLWLGANSSQQGVRQPMSTIICALSVHQLETLNWLISKETRWSTQWQCNKLLRPSFLELIGTHQATWRLEALSNTFRSWSLTQLIKLLNLMPELRHIVSVGLSSLVHWNQIYLQSDFSTEVLSSTTSNLKRLLKSWKCHYPESYASNGTLNLSTLLRQAVSTTLWESMTQNSTESKSLHSTQTESDLFSGALSFPGFWLQVQMIVDKVFGTSETDSSFSQQKNPRSLWRPSLPIQISHSPTSRVTLMLP